MSTPDTTKTCPDCGQPLENTRQTRCRTCARKRDISRSHAQQDQIRKETQAFWDKQRGEKKRRPCLKCGKVIWSTPGFRLCPTCRAENEHEESYRRPICKSKPPRHYVYPTRHSWGTA